MPAERTRALLTRYLDSGHTDLSMLADDVVFTNMATGEDAVGRDGVRRMLDHIYHTAFDARGEVRTLVCETSHAVLEALFVGRHIGEFAGVTATGKEVRVPFCVVYDLVDERIERARVYFEIPVLMEQLGVAPVAASQ